MSRLHTTIKKDGRKYHYFRPAKSLMPLYGGMVRLSDDREEAEKQARALSERESSEEDGRRLSKVESNVARIMVNNATGRSKKRGLSLPSISKDDVVRLMRAQQYRCAVTRLPFSLDWRQGKDAGRNAYAPSLDRMDNRVGYTLENCRVVLSALNYAMNEWGLDVYMTIARAAVAAQNLNKSFKPGHEPVHSVQLAEPQEEQNVL